MQQGTYAAKTICDANYEASRNGTGSHFKYFDKGDMAVIGRWGMRWRRT